MNTIRSIVVAVGIVACTVLNCLGESVDTNRLLYAIGQVNMTEYFTGKNVYGISYAYWDDVNKYKCWRWHKSSYWDMVTTYWVAVDYVIAYWEHYCPEYEKETGKTADAEVMTRIHYGGPKGWKNPETEVFWKSVRKHYDK